MKALLLIDIQYDFLPGGALAVPGGDDIIPVVNRLQEGFDLVVATQDWHPAGHHSFASSHEGRQLFETIDVQGLEQVLWPDHCIQETPGADFTDAISWGRVEAIFRKGTELTIDSYSGFYDNGHRKGTGLAHYLRGRGVQEVYIAGLAADYCVYYTAKDALKEGFVTHVVEDATRPITIEGFEKAKSDIEQRGGRVIRSTDL